MSYGYNIYLHGLKRCSVTCDVVTSYMNRLKKRSHTVPNPCKASSLTSHNVVYKNGKHTFYIRHTWCVDR